jgi:hypothetical protein
MAAAAIMASGCAKKEYIRHEEPVKAAEIQATPSAETKTAAALANPEKMKYNVKKGDSLWVISSKNSVYGNPFEWPLVFKANRDQIQDPDIIEVNQEFDIYRDYSNADEDKAVKNAEDTPLYSRHTKPNKKLPLKY